MWCSVQRNSSVVDNSGDIFVSVVHSFETPSLVLYVLVVYAIVVNYKHFKNPFFDICLSLAAADFLFIGVQKVLVFLKIFCDFGAAVENYASLVAGNVIMSLWNGAFFAQMTGVMLLCVNRYTAITRPFQHKKIWKSKLVRGLLAFQWLSPLAYVLVQMCYRPVGIYFKSQPYASTPDLDFENRFAFAALFLFISLYECVFAITMSVMYSVMAWRLFQNTKRSGPSLSRVAPTNPEARSGGLSIRERVKKQAISTQSVATKKEVKLALLGAILTLTMLAKQIRSVIVLFEFLRHISSDSWLVLFALRLWTLCKTIFNYSNPYFLLYTSRLVRSVCVNELKRPFGRHSPIIQEQSTKG